MSDNLPTGVDLVVYRYIHRDVLALRAPTDPQPWFEPVMPPAPKKIAYRGAARTTEEIDTHDRELHDWHQEKIKQKYIQWPYAWADAVLQARDRLKDSDAEEI